MPKPKPEPYDFDYPMFLEILKRKGRKCNPRMYARLYVRGCNKMKAYDSGDLRRERGGHPPRACNSFFLRNMAVGNLKHIPQDEAEREFWKSLQRWMKIKHAKVWPGYKYRPQKKKKKAKVCFFVTQCNIF